MEAAAKYLSSRMRTVSEVRDYLHSRGYSAEETDETVSELIVSDISTIISMP